MVSLRAHGMKNAAGGELLNFENGSYGMASKPSTDVGIATSRWLPRMSWRRYSPPYGKIMEVPVGESLISVLWIRLVVSWRCGEIHTVARPVEAPAPVMQRKSVSEPLQTGLKAIDALMPIGRGRVSWLSVTVRRGKQPLRLMQSWTKDQIWSVSTSRLDKKNQQFITETETLRQYGTCGLHNRCDSLCFTTISLIFPSSLCWGCYGGRIYVSK